MFRTKNKQKHQCPPEHLFLLYKRRLLFLIDVHATIVLSGRRKKAKTRDEKQKLTYLASLFKLSPRIHLSITVKTNENILIITWGLYIYIYIFIYICI